MSSQRYSILLLLALLVSSVGLVVLFRSPSATGAGVTIPVEASVQSRTVGGTGAVEMVDPELDEAGETSGVVAAAAIARRAAVVPAPAKTRAPVIVEEWRIVFRPVPQQSSALYVRVEPKHGAPVVTVSKPMKDSDLHSAIVILSRGSVADATLQVATSAGALASRDGRLFRLSHATSWWMLGSTALQSGRKDRFERTIADLVVPLTGPSPVGAFVVLGKEAEPAHVLVWTVASEGFPVHTLLESLPIGDTIAVGTFVLPERWFADVPGGEGLPRSQGAAGGAIGAKLSLTLR